MLAKKLEAAVAGQAAGATYVEDVFSTYLYIGNDSTNTITNDINLSGEGGLVWIKNRTDGEISHTLYDSTRSLSSYLQSNSTATLSTSEAAMSSFNSNGFTLSGSGSTVNNWNGFYYSSWTFRKAPKFFDMVTYTGDGVSTGRAISHNLGSAPGFIIVKRTNNTGGWYCYHRSIGATEVVYLNATNAQNGEANAWRNTAPTSTHFTVGIDLNAISDTYVAYLFAHDAGGFGDSGEENVISCGSYTGTGGIVDINLGYEAQWVLIKNTIGVSSMSWYMLDSIRGMPVTSFTPSIEANSDNSETTSATSSATARVTKTGFTVDGSLSNASGDNYIYIAIRRGPMRTPTDATKVFSPTTYTATNVDNRYVETGVTMDTVWARTYNNTSANSFYVADRLRGDLFIGTGASNMQAADGDSFDQVPSGWGNCMSMMNGYGCGNDANRRLNYLDYGEIAYSFKRAPGFYDVVTYTGTGTARTVQHLLGVTPELILVKALDYAQDWDVYAAPLGATKFIQLNSDSAALVSSTRWNDTSPTSSVFTVGTGDGVNASGYSYIAYLFASCPGVSKIGSYNGTGTTAQIDCGFSTGARFIMIKCTSQNAENWYVWDSARGITSGNDPFLFANTSAIQDAGTDYIDPYSAGFELTSTSSTINATGQSYIYLAIA